MFLITSMLYFFFFFFKQKTAYDMRISDWSSDVSSSDLADAIRLNNLFRGNDAGEMLAAVVADGLVGSAAIVSSFGAESAVLLHLVTRAAPDLPVLFLDTGKHFEETLAYREIGRAHV